MTKKHFIEAANIIKGVTDTETRDNIAHEFADMFAKRNKYFNRKLFFNACGL